MLNHKKILKWTIQLLICIVLAVFINMLSDKYGKGFIMLSALLVAGLLFCIGKALSDKK